MKNIKRKHKDRLKRRYKMKRNGLPVTKEEIKEKIKAKNKKIKRYQSIFNDYQQNATLRTIKESFIVS